MSTLKVWLGGEGSNDLGDSDQPEHCRKQPGALEALLRRQAPSGWKVFGATRWKSLRKYVAGGAIGKEGQRGPGDARNVKGLLLQAHEKGAEVLALLRDVDDHEERDALIQQAIKESQQKAHAQPVVIAGFPRPALEAWLLALLGCAHTDAMSKRKIEEKLRERGVELKSTADYVGLIEGAQEALPAGCESLGRWQEQAGQLAALVEAGGGKGA